MNLGSSSDALLEYMTASGKGDNQENISSYARMIKLWTGQRLLYLQVMIQIWLPTVVPQTLQISNFTSKGRQGPETGDMNLHMVGRPSTSIMGFILEEVQ